MMLTLLCRVSVETKRESSGKLPRCELCKYLVKWTLLSLVYSDKEGISALQNLIVKINIKETQGSHVSTCWELQQRATTKSWF